MDDRLTRHTIYIDIQPIAATARRLLLVSPTLAGIIYERKVFSIDMLITTILFALPFYVAGSVDVVDDHIHSLVADLSKCLEDERMQDEQEQALLSETFAMLDPLMDIVYSLISRDVPGLTTLLSHRDMIKFTVVDSRMICVQYE